MPAGFLAINHHKRNATHPDMCGTLRVEINGQWHTLSIGAWFQTSTAGDKYLTLTARRMPGDDSDLDRAFGAMKETA